MLLVSCGHSNTEARQESGRTATLEADSTQLNLPDTTIVFLWRDMKFDSILNDSVNSIFLSEAYLAKMTKPEKAAIGYVSTFIGNECWWDGQSRNDRSNLDCKIITALGLGYQCSETHLGFLRNWFSTDKQVLSELGKSNCPTTPYTATTQGTFDKIVVKTKGDSISVYYQAIAVNFREQESWEWSETAYFSATTEKIKLIKKKASEVINKKLEITEK